MKCSILKIFSILIILLMPLLAFAEATEEEIFIGLIPEINIFEQYERYDSLASYLTNKTGVKVSLTILNKYGNIIDEFVSKKLDGAFFGSFTGVLATEKLHVEALARPVTSDGKSTYHAYIFVRKDSGIKNVKDMEGKVMAFIDKASSCGYIFPLAYFKENGVTNLDKFFREYYFVGSHDVGILSVLMGHADVGVAKNTVYDLLKKQYPRIDKELVILTESSKFPSHGLFVRKSLNENIKKKLKEWLLSMDRDPQGRIVLNKFGAIKFVEVDVTADYKSVFEVSKRAGINLKTYNYK